MPSRPFLHLVLPACFLLFALPVLLFLAIAVPTGEVPDEVAHMLRMEGLLHGSIVGHRQPRLDMVGATVPDGGVTANAALLAAGYAFTSGTPLAERVLTAARMQELRRLPWEPRPEFVRSPNTAVYAPLFYLPGAVAMGVAELAGMGPWKTILVARVMNAVLYAVLGVVALLVAQRGRGLVFATLVLPMSLWLAASCNQDGLVIGTGALAAALLSRGTVRGWWAGTLVLTLMVLAKPPYAPLVGLVMLLLPGRGAQPGLRIGGAVLAAGPAVAWFLVAQHYAGVGFVREGPFHPGPYWPGDPGLVFGFVEPALQLQVLAARPWLLFTLPFDTWDADPWVLHGMVGILGLLDILLPAWLYGLWGWALPLAALGGCMGTRRVRAPGTLAAVAGLACVVASVLAVYAGQYLSWSRTGWAIIEGIQGRYFIPLLPFVGLALPHVVFAAAGGVRAALQAPAVAAAAAGAAVIPALVVTIYYLH